MESGGSLVLFNFCCISFEIWELSSVGSEHLPYKQGVIGSNPIAPTPLRPCKHYTYRVFCFKLIVTAFARLLDLDKRNMINSKKAIEHLNELVQSIPTQSGRS